MVGTTFFVLYGILGETNKGLGKTQKAARGRSMKARPTQSRKGVKGQLPELEAALKEIIAETGATSGKDMGKVMGVASKKLAGLAEGRAISAKVKELLG